MLKIRTRLLSVIKGTNVIFFLSLSFIFKIFTFYFYILNQTPCLHYPWILVARFRHRSMLTLLGVKSYYGCHVARNEIETGSPIAFVFFVSFKEKPSAAKILLLFTCLFLLQQQQVSSLTPSCRNLGQ